MFFFNDTATTEIYALSLHDALPISLEDGLPGVGGVVGVAAGLDHHRAVGAVVDGDHAVADQVVVVDRDVVGDDHADGDVLDRQRGDDGDVAGVDDRGHAAGEHGHRPVVQDVGSHGEDGEGQCCDGDQ